VKRAKPEHALIGETQATARAVRGGQAS